MGAEAERERLYGDLIEQANSKRSPVGGGDKRTLQEAGL